MKNLILAMLFAFAATASAAGLVYWNNYSINTTAGAPDAGNTFAPLNGGRYFRVLLRTDAGSTFTGGSMLCYYQDDVIPGIQRCPSADFTINPLDAGTVSSQAFQTGLETGGVYYAPSSVTMNSGDAGGRFDVVIEVQK